MSIKILVSMLLELRDIFRASMQETMRCDNGTSMNRLHNVASGDWTDRKAADIYGKDEMPQPLTEPGIITAKWLCDTTRAAYMQISKHSCTSCPLRNNAARQKFRFKAPSCQGARKGKQ